MPTRQDGVENRDKVYYMRMLQMNPPLVVFWGSVKCRRLLFSGLENNGTIVIVTPHLHHENNNPQ